MVIFMQSQCEHTCYRCEPIAATSIRIAQCGLGQHLAHKVG
jgi:hypothetical protein